MYDWAILTAAGGLTASTVVTLRNPETRRDLYQDFWGTWLKRINFITILVISILLFTTTHKHKDKKMRHAAEKAILALVIVFFASSKQMFAPFWAVLGLSYMLSI